MQPLEIVRKNRVVTAIIASGASLSGVVDAGGMALVGIVMPSGWTAADITLQGSMDGIRFVEILDSYGSKCQLKAEANAYVPLRLPELIGVRYFKLRSGTVASAVNQSAERVVECVLRAI